MSATPLSTFTPFPGYTGAVRSVVGDFNGDGVEDTAYVVGPGGGSLVRVIDGATGKDLLTAGTVSTYEAGFTGGLFAAAADFSGTGRDDLIVSPDDGGGGRIQVFSIANGILTQVANFFGINDTNFRGGARVATGDINDDGVPDLVVTAGTGGGPRVAVFDGKSIASGSSNPNRLVPDFFAFNGADTGNLRDGAYVAVGDVNGDGYADLVFGAGPGGGPRVFILDGKTLMTEGSAAAAADPIANFFTSGDASDRGGVRVATKEATGGTAADLVVGSGEGMPSQVWVYSHTTLTSAIAGVPPVSYGFDPFGSQSLADGIYVG